MSRCMTCEGAGILANLDGESGLVPAPGWTGPIVQPDEDGLFVCDVGEGCPCTDCQTPADWTPERIEARRRWLAPTPVEALVGFVTGKPRKLSDINAELKAVGRDLVLVVGHWDGEGEPEPTTLELMTPVEYGRRCELVPGHDQSLSGIAAEAAQVSVIPMPNGRGVSS